VRALYSFTLKQGAHPQDRRCGVSHLRANGVTWFDLSAKLLTVVGRVDNTTEGTVELTAFG
jgi:hypothetical protein